MDPATRPFCSERCRLADLGRWLSEDYRVPVNESDPYDDDEAGARAPGAGRDSDDSSDQ